LKRRLRLQTGSLVGSRACSVCGRRLFGFQPLPAMFLDEPRNHGYPYSVAESETCNAENYSCPLCGAADRDRLYALFLQEHLPKVSSPTEATVIDFAPSPPLSEFIRRLTTALPQKFRYRTADLLMDNVNDPIDITNMPSYPDESIDFFVCSHVLEHVSDDRQALRELYRILNVGGRGILMVPIVLTLDEVDEDPSVTDVAERWRRFGQWDHVRLYSKAGFLARVHEVGFAVQQFGHEHFGREVFRKYGITEQSVLYVVEKR